MPVYYSVDAATAAAGSGGIFAPGDVLVTVGGGPPVVYAPAPLLGLDIVGGPFTDDLDALAVFDTDGFPFVYSPGVDVAYFSVGPGSAIVGAPSPCPGAFSGAGIGTGDILTEGTFLGAPGAACILAKGPQLLLWDVLVCGPNPVTGFSGDDNLDALDIRLFVPTATPTDTPTPADTSTETPTPTAAPPSPTPTPTVGGAFACPPTPATCTTPAKSTLKIKDKGEDGAGLKDRLIWKWIRGPATAQVDFGDPTSTAAYTLCIYAGAAQAVVMGARGAAGGTCDGRDCWNPISTRGYKFKDKAAAQDGIFAILLKGSTLPKSKILFKGKNGNLDLTAATLPLPVDGPVKVRVHNRDNGNCWGADFPTPFKQNGEVLFLGETP